MGKEGLILYELHTFFVFYLDVLQSDCFLSQEHDFQTGMSDQVFRPL